MGTTLLRIIVTGRLLSFLCSEIICYRKVMKSFVTLYRDPLIVLLKRETPIYMRY